MTQTSAQRDEYRFTAEDECRIATRLAEVVAGWTTHQRSCPTDAATLLTLERLAASAVGCTAADLRGSELEWIAGAVAQAVR